MSVNTEDEIKRLHERLDKMEALLNDLSWKADNTLTLIRPAIDKLDSL